MKYRLGIDMGGSAAKIALVNEENEVVKGGIISTAAHPKPQVLIQSLGRLCNAFMKGKDIAQVGVGVAGEIDFQRGVVRLAPNLGWRNIPLRKMLQNKLRRHVVVDNDANVAALGIYHTQVSKRIKHLIVMTLGTGVGGGIILNGRLHRGTTGSAGEVGHCIMYDKGRPCNCGHFGCLETYVGGFYITRSVKKALEKGQPSQLRTLFEEDPDRITPLTIDEAARRGDRFARSVWRNVGHVLGIALGNLIYVFNPEIVYLTGGVAQAKGLILKPLRETLRERTFRGPISQVKIKVAEGAEHIGAIGASLL